MDNPKTGSGSLKEPVFALIGSLQRVHGVHGEIEMRVLTNFRNVSTEARKFISEKTISR